MACVSVELFRRQALLCNAVHARFYSKLKVMETEQIPVRQLSCVHIPILYPQLQGKIRQHKPPAREKLVLQAQVAHGCSHVPSYQGQIAPFAVCVHVCSVI